MVTSPNYQVKKGSRLAFEVTPLYVDDNKSTVQNPSFCPESSISSGLKCEDNDRGSAAISKTNSDTSGSKVNGENGTGIKSEVEIGAYRGGQIPDSLFYDTRQRRPGLATTTRWPCERLDAARKPADDLIDYDTESSFSTFTQFWCIVAMHGSTSTWGTPTGEFDMHYDEKDLWRCVSTSSILPVVVLLNGCRQ